MKRLIKWWVAHNKAYCTLGIVSEPLVEYGIVMRFLLGYRINPGFKFRSWNECKARH